LDLVSYSLNDPIGEPKLGENKLLNQTKHRSKFVSKIFKIQRKSVNIVAKMIQILSLGEVWAALGAYQSVFVVSWDVLGVSCGVLGAS